MKRPKLNDKEARDGLLKKTILLSYIYELQLFVLINPSVFRQKKLILSLRIKPRMRQSVREVMSSNPSARSFFTFFTCFKHSDWLFNIFQPISVLQYNIE